MVQTLPKDSKESIKKKFELATGDGKRFIQSLSLKERCEKMMKFSSELEKNENELADILTNEVGKPIQQSLGEVRATRGRIKFFVDNLEKCMEDQVVLKTEGFKEIIKREPLGTILNISAWNYPYFVGTNVIVPALLTGNTVLYKPSEYSTMTGLKMAEMLKNSGFENSIQTFIGDGIVGQDLLKLDVNGVFFTGSYNTGKKINESVSSKLIKVQLELGGKDPVYVHNDVDIVNVAKALVEGAMYNAGQSCCSVERIYVHEDIKKEFIAAFIEEMQTLKIGDPRNTETDLGPLTRREQIDVLEEQIRDAVEKGGIISFGGNRFDYDGGFYFQPTLITKVNHTMKLMTEESFGPIIGIQSVSSHKEAIELMNDTIYGLTSAVYSVDEKVAMEVLDKIDSGTVYWNRCDSVSPRLPWSGRKCSGLGLTLSLEGITTFTNPKAYNLRW